MIKKIERERELKMLRLAAKDIDSKDKSNAMEIQALAIAVDGEETGGDISRDNEYNLRCRPLS